MPTYGYACDKCGHTFEAWQKITDKPLEICPLKDCGGHISRAIGGGGGFILKGTGFYATDYRSGDYKKKKAGEYSVPKPPSDAGSSGRAASPAPKKDS